MSLYLNLVPKEVFRLTSSQIWPILTNNMFVLLSLCIFSKPKDLRIVISKCFQKVGKNISIILSFFFLNFHFFKKRFFFCFWRLIRIDSCGSGYVGFWVLLEQVSMNLVKLGWGWSSQVKFSLFRKLQSKNNKKLMFAKEIQTGQKKL